MEKHACVGLGVCVDGVIKPDWWGRREFRTSRTLGVSGVTGGGV